MDIKIAGKAYTLGKIRANRENMAKVFNISDNSGTPEAHYDFLDLLEIALVAGSGRGKADEALDNLTISDIAKSDSDYAQAYTAIIVMSFGRKEPPKDDGRA